MVTEGTVFSVKQEGDGSPVTTENRPLDTRQIPLYYFLQGGTIHYEENEKVFSNVVINHHDRFIIPVHCQCRIESGAGKCDSGRAG